MVTVVGIRGSFKAVKPVEKGFTVLGDKHFIADSVKDKVCEQADMFLQSNMLKPKFSTKNGDGPYEYIIKSGKPFLVQESPNFREFVTQESKYFRLGWYSYKWTDGIFGNENSPPDRWKKFVKETGIKIKDWNSPGDHILIMGQKEGDSSLVDLYNNGYKGFYSWVQETVNNIRKYTDRKIIIRPHPRHLRAGLKGAKSIKGDNVFVSEFLSTEGGSQGGQPLEQDLKRCHCVVTYNSLSAIESITRGIPTFALHNGSMIWPIAHKDLSEIENLKYDIDITQWCNDIAYTQWTRDEQYSGEAWAHLKPLVFKN